MAEPHASPPPVNGGHGHLAEAVARLRPFLAIALIVVLADQVSKVVIRGWLAVGESWPGRDGLLQLTHVENSGAAFGILQDARVFLLIMPVVGIGALLVFLYVAPISGRLYTTALAFVLGGATGNFIDRATGEGSVTDFIDPTHYPAFNLADSAIVVGVATIVLLSFFEDSDEPAAAEPAESGE
jgi:signal peptidase II